MTRSAHAVVPAFERGADLVERSFRSALLGSAGAGAGIHGGGLTVVTALALAEAVRGRWPLGGLPLAGLALGQANGPFATGERGRRVALSPPWPADSTPRWWWAWSRTRPLAGFVTGSRRTGPPGKREQLRPLCL
jgi:hypothetical protein